jgi:hypothetical protein
MGEEAARTSQSALRVAELCSKNRVLLQSMEDNSELDD